MTHLDEEGRAHITVDAVLRGEAPPPIIDGVSLSCFSGPPKLYGMEGDNKRYIVVLAGSELYEETSYFAVDGERCHAWTAESYSKQWQPCTAVRAMLTAPAPASTHKP